MLLALLDQPEAVVRFRALVVCAKVRFRPEIALRSSILPNCFWRGAPRRSAAALAHLDFAVEEFRAMKMQPALGGGAPP